MSEKRRHLLLAIYGYGTLALAFASLGLVMFWAFYPYKTIEHNPENYAIEDKVVKQGDVTHYNFDYCKFTDEAPVITKWFIDGIVYEAPPLSMQLRKGCGHARVILKIPENLPPGKYKMKIEAAFHPNPIRTITETNITQEFEVVRATDGAYGPTPNEENIKN